jgi:type VI secretion system FHA domain protein
VQPPPAAPSPPEAASPAARLVAAFLEGAGVPTLDLSGQDPEAYFRMLGELVRTMTESLRDVLMSRTAIKGEFGIEQTMLRSRNNNALKFSLGPQDAVAALLQPGLPGYMPPVEAAREAFDDVRLHQLAVMAGVQAALFNLLQSFDPQALEARLEKRSMIDSILPGTRRAKLWEAFCAAYKDIARDADSDFQAVFGREFSRAYSAHTGSGRVT